MAPYYKKALKGPSKELPTAICYILFLEQIDIFSFTYTVSNSIF